MGYEDRYEVSDAGHVYSLLTDKLLKQGLDPKGKPRVTLYGNGTRQVVRVHVLVLEAFVGPRPEGMEACHYDDSGANNHLSNLRWDTPSGNTQDRVRNGLHNMARKTHCLQNHEFTQENTGLNPRPDGGMSRYCRTCRREGRRRRANLSKTPETKT